MIKDINAVIRFLFGGVSAITALSFCSNCEALDVRVLDSRLHHLRHGIAREWSDFPEHAEAAELNVDFDAAANLAEQTLRVRTRDLKLQWTLRLNDRELARLPLDENAMVTYWAIPPGTLATGANHLHISCNAPAAERASDDVMIGDIALIDSPRKNVVGEATVDVTVTESDPKKPIPCRLTIADKTGALIDTGNISDNHLAVRTGVVYTGDGHVLLSLPAGQYSLYAGRGFAYGVDSKQIDLHPGANMPVEMSLRKEVPLYGYISCDTHVHTFTWSHHGDATVAERMLTIAGEGIELPIATDHNLQIDEDPVARSVGVRQYFTPVIGNEVTTARLGHFNVFPIESGAHLLNWRLPTWSALGANFKEVAGDPVIILNHARDIHGGFRPFDPSRHISCTGEDLDGWDLPANAMEIINSGATRADPLELCRDWFGMLNRGKFLTPIGASDSHDVSRYIIGQARTYIRCDSTDPSQIDVAQAMRSLREGRVLVSYGLVADIKVAGKYGSGDLVPGNVAGAEGGFDVSVQVLGPQWTTATAVTLYANGTAIHEEKIAEPTKDLASGVKWQGTWKLPRPSHDLWLVAVATGKGVIEPYWPMAKPYQPTSPIFTAHAFAASGAIRVDADGSGQFDSVYEYASKIVKSCKGDLPTVITALRDYDQPTASQAAGLLRAMTPDSFADRARPMLAGAAPPVRAGFEDFLKDWISVTPSKNLK